MAGSVDHSLSSLPVQPFCISAPSPHAAPTPDQRAATIQLADITTKKTQGIPLFHYEQCIVELANPTDLQKLKTNTLLNQLEADITRDTKLTRGEHQFLKAVRANTQNSKCKGKAEQILAKTATRTNKKIIHAKSPHARGYKIGENPDHYLDQAAQGAEANCTEARLRNKAYNLFAGIKKRYENASKTKRPFYLTNGERFVLKHARQHGHESQPLSRKGATNTLKTLAANWLAAAVPLPATPRPRRAHGSTPRPHIQALGAIRQPSPLPDPGPNVSTIKKQALDIVNALTPNSSAGEFDDAVEQLHILLYQIKNFSHLNSIDKSTLITHVYEQRLALEVKWKATNINPEQLEIYERLITRLQNHEPLLFDSQKTDLYFKIEQQKDVI